MINLIKGLFQKQGIRFLFVGGLNTAVGYGVYALIIYAGLGYVPAQTIAMVVGIIHSYFWNKYFTFKQPEKSKSEVVRFISVYAVSYLTSLAILHITVDVFVLSEYVAGLISLVFTTIISYFGHKLFSFRKKA